MARPPVKPFDTRPFGAYGTVRSSPQQGSCGIGTYPCTHWASDIVAPAGTVVAAPTDGWVIVSRKWDNDKASPFGGYGPGVVLFAHDDRAMLGNSQLTAGVDQLPEPLRTMMRVMVTGKSKGQTAFYSLLGHVDPDHLAYDIDYDPKELESFKGSTAAAKYRGIGAAGAVDAGTTSDPPAEQDNSIRVTPWPSKYVYVKEGAPLAVTLGPPIGHVHWEIRKGPIAHFSQGGSTDPGMWLTMADPGTDWTQAKPSPRVDLGAGKASIGKLLFGFGLAYLASKALDDL